MDKLRPYLLLLKKHHFWILCVVVMGVSYWGWNAGAAHFSDQYAKDKRTIESKFTALRAIESKPNHPNATFAAAATKIHDDLKKKALAAWTSLYEQQKPELVWIDELRPHLADKPADTEVPERVRYTLTSDFANKYVPQLYEHLGVLTEEQWLAPKRADLMTRYTWSRTPTTAQLRYAQEDLWVYTALLKVIGETNQGAQGLFNAPIKQIRDLRIAQAANQPAESTIENVTAQMRPTQVANVSVPSRDATDEELLAGRYLDSAAPAPGATSSSQSKRIPIYMALTIREENIPDLLAACANSPLPVEVRQCRLLPVENTETKVSGGTLRGTGEVILHLYGTIYVFSPPNPQALGIGNALNDPTGNPAAFDPNFANP